MQNGVELVVHHVSASGEPICLSYDNVRLANPVLVVLADYGTAASRAYQLALLRLLDAELTRGLRATRVMPPCRGNAPGLGDCHALADPAADKLLVLIGDDRSPPSAEAITLSNAWTAAGAGHSILPVFPRSAKSTITSLLPASASPANAAFWQADIREVLSDLLSSAGITTRQPRIFISYRQTDSAALAIQLFDELSHNGFDVFLDHFRIAPGVNFQARLTQELGDKSMLLVLESKRLAESQWVTHEISVAKSCGLGLLGLLLPNAPRHPSLDEGYRQKLRNGDFLTGSFDAAAVLKPAALDRIISSIKTSHDRAIVARRRMLELSFEGALAQQHCTNVQRTGAGAFHVRVRSREYRVWLTPRPPEMPDFHRAHCAVGTSETGVVIGLSRLMEPAGQARNTWLAGLCCFALADEGQLISVARQIAAGTL